MGVGKGKGPGCFQIFGSGGVIRSRWFLPFNTESAPRDPAQDVVFSQGVRNNDSAPSMQPYNLPTFNTTIEQTTGTPPRLAATPQSRQIRKNSIPFMLDSAMHAAPLFTIKPNPDKPTVASSSNHSCSGPPPQSPPTISALHQHPPCR